MWERDKAQETDGVRAAAEVIVAAYNPQWAEEFERERDLLTRELQDIIKGIEHIGSTAVPGLAAKPIIDLMIGVEELEVLTDAHIERLRRQGYHFVEHAHFPDRRFFRRGAWRVGTHHLHCYKYMGDHWHANLLFRNHLIRHPEVRQAYQTLKKQLEQQFKHDRAGYTQAKAPFIQAILKGVNS